MTTPSRAFWIDTDIGVDDAVAIAWLLAEPSATIVGCSTVVGNTSLENATRNIMTLLAVAGRELPVHRGAAAPLVVPAYLPGVSAFVHGPSGFWDAQAPYDIGALPSDAPEAIICAAQEHPGLTILALGPLTNIALAWRLNPTAMAGTHLIMLAGAQHGGNRTAVAEFNAFFDPHALAEVLAHPHPITMIPRDAFDQLAVDPVSFPAALAAAGPLGALLARALSVYLGVQSGQAHAVASIPDAVAAIYALRPDLAQTQPALVRVIADDGPARGQTIIATDLRGHMGLLATDAELSAMASRVLQGQSDLANELGQILQRQPDNLQLVLAIDADRMRQALLDGLYRVSEN